jgi:formate dehydrogenase major subunit
MGASTCVACGECVRACPTGALMPARGAGLVEPDKSVDSVCPYCGVGCQLTYRVKDNRIIRVDGRDGPANDGRLCVKGRYGFDYATHAQRLSVPLIRVDSSYPKGPLSGAVRQRKGRRPGGLVDDREVLPHFREASWDEALELVARRLGAQCHLVSYGGRGIIRDWQGIRDTRNAPVFYELALPDDPAVRWDHMRYVPDAIGILRKRQCVGAYDHADGQVAQHGRQLE